MTKQPDNSSSNEDREERFDEICADFLDAVDGGQAFDKAEVLSANPDLAESLQNFFRDHARMAGVLDVEDTGPHAGTTESTTGNSIHRTIALDGSSGHERTGSSGESLLDGPSKRIADYELIEKIAHAEAESDYIQYSRSCLLPRTSLPSSFPVGARAVLFIL